MTSKNDSHPVMKPTPKDGETSNILYNTPILFLTKGTIALQMASITYGAGS